MSGSVPTLPRLGHREDLMLTFLTGVQIWNVSFFDSVQSYEISMDSFQQGSATFKEVGFTLKLATDLLDRGHGSLAGRMARKAFLLLENMLTLEGPAFVWNLLEAMHHMMTLRHVQLFRMLLAHLIALADGRMLKTHPFLTMLRSLQILVANLITNGSIMSLPVLLEQAWILNAKLLFDHFDPRLFPLYLHIHWDSWSMNLPSFIVSAANQWFGRIEAHHIPNAAAEAHGAEENRMHQRLLAPRMDASPPRDYRMLRVSNIAALWDHWSTIVSRGLDLNAISLRILAGLGNAKVIEEWSAINEPSEAASNVTARVPRIHAGNLACAMRTLLDLHHKHNDGVPGPLLDVVEQNRSILALREYAYGEIDAHVVWDMWSLEDALIAAGEDGAAQEVGGDALRRLEKYMQDIPADSA